MQSLIIQQKLQKQVFRGVNLTKLPSEVLGVSARNLRVNVVYVGNPSGGDRRGRGVRPVEPRPGTVGTGVRPVTLQNVPVHGPSPVTDGAVPVLHRWL